MKGWETVIEIKQLLSEKLDVLEVARRLKVDRKTVRKYRDMDMDGVAAARRKAGRPSRKVNRFKELVKQRVEAMAADGVVNAWSDPHLTNTVADTAPARTLRLGCVCWSLPVVPGQNIPPEISSVLVIFSSGSRSPDRR